MTARARAVASAARDRRAPFGSIKQWVNHGAVLMRGLDNVHGELGLTALAYNRRRVLNVFGEGARIAAVTDDRKCCFSPTTPASKATAGNPLIRSARSA